MRKLDFLSLALVGLLAGSPAGAVFRIVAFGDSITNAIPFDLSSGSACQAGNSDTCGYSARLESSQYFDCKPSVCEIANRGKASEKTAVGLTRIDAVLREKDWDFIILMEGTNDLAAGISTQTVDFNLARMADKAKARGVGTAQASTIWFYPSFDKPGTGGRNEAVKRLRSLIRSRTSSEKRCFVDPTERLCPPGGQQASCFTKHYWDPPDGLVDHVGHPDSSGYDLLAKEFYSVLGAPGAPGAAEPVGPVGEACGEKLKVEWRKETTADADCGNWFRIQIDGSRGNKFDDWYQEDDVCSGSDCSVIVPVKLKKGSFSYRVRTRNTSGIGPWTADESFTSVPSAPRQISQLFGPAGDVYSNGGLDADFRWKPGSDAESYRLQVVSALGGVAFEELLEGGEECTEAECSFSPPMSFAAGKYSWRVMAENICGGTWSESAQFEVFDSAPAQMPQTVSPTTRIFDNTPVFRWETVPGATEYEIEDALGNSTTLAAVDICRGGICRFASALLAPGPHTWRVRSLNPLGQGPWSQTMSFEVADCDCFEGRAAGGSSYLMAVPEGWNGDLVLWTYGSNFHGVREIEDFGPLAQNQFDEGYALATTSYSVSGWPLFKSERDLEKVIKVFNARYGKPTNVFLAGESTGALVAGAALEDAKLGNVVGALTMCGPLAGARNWEAALDLRLAYDAICADVPGAEILGGSKGLPRTHDLEPLDIIAAVNFCTGVDKQRPDRATAEKRRLKDLLAVTGLAETGFQDAMQLATFGLADLVRDKKKLKGKLPVGNLEVDYGSASLNDSIQRVRAEPQAERKLAANFELSGVTKDAKVISLHTTKDSVFFVENESEFAEIAPVESFLPAIVEESKASHCGFQEVEQLAAWKTLTTWVDSGKKPKSNSLGKRCRKLKSTTGGECRFKNKPKLAPLDTRVRPRS